MTKHQRRNPRRPLTNEELCEAYPWVILGTLQQSTAKGPKGKRIIRTVAIQCQISRCVGTRRVPTSSAYQVRFCRHHQRERDLDLLAIRRKRWKDRERAKGAP